MAENPQTSPKEHARWFIPSTYNDHDARIHEVQRLYGSFAWLTLDVDTNNLSLEAVDATLSHVIGEASRIIYSTRSATEENKKWRALVPLANNIDGSDFFDTQNAFFDLLEDASEGALIPDRALARPAQLIYLPNHGDFHQVKVSKADALPLLTDHPIIQHRDAEREARVIAGLEAKAALDRRLTTDAAISGRRGSDREITNLVDEPRANSPAVKQAKMVTASHPGPCRPCPFRYGSACGRCRCLGPSGG